MLTEQSAGEIICEVSDESGKQQKERYDIVVLSTALIPPKNVESLKDAVGVDLNSRDETEDVTDGKGWPPVINRILSLRSRTIQRFRVIARITARKAKKHQNAHNG